MVDDQELYSRWMAGDASAGAELVRRHYDALVVSLCGQLGRLHLAQDIAQETWIQMQRGGFSGRGTFAGWMHAVARSKVSRHFRGREGEMAVNSETSPSRRLLEIEVIAAVAELSNSAQREAMHLHFIEGLTPQEIAQQVGAKEKTIRSRIRLALVKLRDRLILADPTTIS